MTYELMASYWPTEAALTDDPEIARRMNALKKVYVSHAQEKIFWHNSTRLDTINADQIRAMKQAPGKDIAIFGSGNVIEQLMPLGVIDEFRFIINPVVLGKGRTIFSTLEEATKLTLIETKKFANGNVRVSYSTSFLI